MDLREAVLRAAPGTSNGSGKRNGRTPAIWQQDQDNCSLRGGGAVVTLAAVGTLTGGGGAAAPSVVSAPQMTIGATATVAYSATEETSLAVPADKAKPYGG